MVPTDTGPHRDYRSTEASGDVFVTEVRVHGVGGASPDQILNRTDIIPEPSTDGVAGFYRSTEDDGLRRVRAYSWGGLTSRTASRALWTVLLPFSFVNIAGWMMEPSRDELEGEEAAAERSAAREGRRPSEKWLADVINKLNRRVFRATNSGLAKVQRWLVHVLAVTVTATYVTWVAMLTVDLVGYQCGSRPACYSDRAWLEYLSVFRDRVGLRLVLGALIPIALLFVFLWLSRRSRDRYDLFRAGESKAAECYGSQPPKLVDEAFWRQSGFITNMSRIHFAAAMTLLAGCLSYATWRFSAAFGLSGPESIGRWLTLAAAFVFALSLRAIWLMLRGPSESAGWRQVVEGATRTAFRMSLGLMAITLPVVASLRVSDAAIVNPLNEAIPLWGFGWLAFGLLASGVAVLAILTALQLVRWGIEGTIDWGQFVIPVSLLVVAIFPFWWVLLPLALFLIVKNLLGGIRDDGSDPQKRRDTHGWIPVVVFGAFVALGFLDSAWFVVATSVAAIIAAYQLVAAPQDQDSFRWFGTAAVGAVGVFGLTGVLAGISLRLKDLLEVGGSTLLIPPATGWIALAAFLATVLAWTAALLQLLAVWAHKHAAWKEEEQSRWSDASLPIDNRDHKDISGVVWLRAVRTTVRSVDVLITVYAMLLFSAAVAGLGWLIRNDVPSSEWLDHGVGPSLAALLELATWAELLFVGAAYLAVRSALRDRGWRRRLGMVWDIASFWPNRYHPFAPPAYAARAVPELIDRVQMAVADTGPEGSGGGAILSGHSQGSVLCFAAVAALSEEDAGRVILATHGSPLGYFYRTFFPDVFSPEVFRTVGDKLYEARSCRGSWVNFYRKTDPIAGKIAGEYATEFRSTGEPLEGLSKAIPDLGALPDVVLPDPCLTVRLGTLRPHARVHSDYEIEPCMKEALEVLTRHLASNSRQATNAVGPQGAGSKIAGANDGQGIRSVCGATLQRG